VRALERADVVIYDFLAAEQLLDHAPARAERVYVGKRGGVHAAAQDAINEMLVRLAQDGKTVVRLKGGDPYLFGRGSEEAVVLYDHGVAFEVIPGVPAAMGAAAAAGIPLTDRRYNATVTFVTGHESVDTAPGRIDWDALARGQSVTVFYMAVSNLGPILETLRNRGLDADTPVAMVEWATLPSQRVLSATVGTAAERAREEQLRAPALVIVGHTAELRHKLAWFERRPLFGRTIAVTRGQAQACELVQSLEDLGARVLRTPLLRMEAPGDWTRVDTAIDRLEGYRWVVFTSPNGIDFFVRRLRARGKDARAFAGAKIAVIGPGTGECLRRYGLEPDLQPPVHTSECLAEHLMAREEMSGARVLLPRADIAPDALPVKLRAAGADTDNIAVYRTCMDDSAVAALRDGCERGKIEAVTFTSSSTVSFFVAALGEKMVERRRGSFAAVSIGPETSAALKRAGIEPACEAREQSMNGVVAALVDLFRTKAGDPQ